MFALSFAVCDVLTPAIRIFGDDDDENDVRVMSFSKRRLTRLNTQSKTVWIPRRLKKKKSTFPN